MNSLEWRVKRLENTVLGQTGRLAHFGQFADQDTICDQLTRVASYYKNFNNSHGDKYAKFVTLYHKYRHLLGQLETNSDNDVSETAKAELVLAYENELVQHLEAVKSMANKGDKVLNVERWPDLSGYKERLDKLEQITKEQHLQSVALDRETESLIEIYNDTIGSFKSNMVIWNQKLEAYENEERKLDEDE